jgi:dTDP-4-amino-4,6-dideoxygalactose transaminase
MDIYYSSKRREYFGSDFWKGEEMKRFGKKEMENISKVMQSEILSSKHGEMTKVFEEKFAARWGAKYGIAMNSAMSVLHSAVAAAGVGPGDEVICDPIVHFGAAAVMYNNGVPVFADVNPYTFNMNPESMVSKVTERTKAIICTHLFGLPCDMDPIVEIARKHNLVVIEDSAQALGAMYKDKYAGTLGDIGIFSFEQSKHITSGDGGIGITNNKIIADEMGMTRLLGWIPEEASDVQERWKKGRLGWNYRITELASAVLLAQLERINDILAEYREGAKKCLKVLGDNKLVKPQRADKGYLHSYWVLAFRYEGDKYGLKYEDFKRIMAEEKAKVSYGYTRVPASNIPLFTEIRAYGKGCPIKCPFYKGKAKYGSGTTPVAEDLLKRVMLFPQDLSNMEKVVKALNRLGY